MQIGSHIPPPAGHHTPARPGARPEAATAHDQHGRDTSPARGHASDAASPQQERQLRELQQRDREVRAHEAAHLAAAGDLAQGGASYSYQRGPDGKLYAVGGEVNIDTSAVPGDPQATLQKAQRIRNAALAPAQPSAQDRAVATEASVMAAEARSAILSEGRDNRSEAETAQADSQPRGGAGPEALRRYEAVSGMDNGHPPGAGISLKA